MSDNSYDFDVHYVLHPKNHVHKLHILVCVVLGIKRLYAYID